MNELTIDPAAVARRLELFITTKVNEQRRDGVIVGLSGGIDSAVVATLAVRALGSETVLGLILPERDSAPESRRLARLLARQLDIRSRTVSMSGLLWLTGAYWQVPLWLLGPRWLQAALVRRIYDRFRQTLGGHETPFSATMVSIQGLKYPWLNRAIAYYRIKVRLRMVLLYYYAELNNLLVSGTDNKTELSVGLFVRYGDSAADIAPLASLYKTQVRELAVYLGVPEAIVARPPSPDILPGLTDESVLEIDYVALDRILWRLEQNLPLKIIARDLDLSPDLVHYVQMLTRQAGHLAAPPDVPLGQ